MVAVVCHVQWAVLVCVCEVVQPSTYEQQTLRRVLFYHLHGKVIRGTTWQEGVRIPDEAHYSREG